MIERVARKLSDLAPHRYKHRSSRGIVAGDPVAWENLREDSRAAFRAAARDVVETIRGISRDEAVRFAGVLSGEAKLFADTPERALARREWLALIDAAQDGTQAT